MSSQRGGGIVLCSRDSFLSAVTTSGKIAQYITQCSRNSSTPDKQEARTFPGALVNALLRLVTYQYDFHGLIVFAWHTPPFRQGCDEQMSHCDLGAAVDVRSAEVSGFLEKKIVRSSTIQKYPSKFGREGGVLTC